MSLITFEIPDRLPSGNEIKRMHYQAEKRLKLSYQWSIMAALAGMASLPSGGILAGCRPGEKKFKVLRIRSFRKRLLDKDRLYHGATALVDAIKKMGLIYDDSPRWIDLKVDQEIDSKCPRTRIEIGPGRRKK